MQRTQKIETQSICASLNLRVQDLNDPYLAENAIYRRLCNIVVNDRNKSEYHYRKNLVKELYFLLKITPIMKPELRESYLTKLELWYNKNDHKKTELGSGRLRDIVDGYVTNKNGGENNNNKVEEDMMQRPQSGVMWNKNVVPFLRPYTAQRQQNSHPRPQSYKSKYGRSTKASTQLQQCCQSNIRDFALSIQQQLQMSQDFIAKSRTAHPQQEPIYQRLYNIIKRAGIKGTVGRNQFEDDENEMIFQRDKEEFMNSQVMNNNNNGQNSTGKDGGIDEQQDEVQILNVQDFGKVSQQSEKQQDQQQQQQQKFLPEQKSPFIKQKKAFINDRDRRISQNKNIKPVQGFLKLQQQNHYDTTLLKKLNNKYRHVTNNKFVNSSKDDNEMMRDYVEYSRVKSAMRREMSRKSESARLMSAKGNRERASLIGGEVKNNPRVYSALPRRRNNDEIQREEMNISTNDIKKEPRFFDLTKPQTSVSLSATNNKQLAHYNQRKQLEKIYRTPIQGYKKFNKATLSTTQIKCKDKNLLTRYDTFLTREKINPIADVHIQEHNRQALDQIEKIKSRVAGLSNKYASTESLMKALYIDSYDDVGSCAVNDGLLIHGTTINFMHDKKGDDPFDWMNRNLYFNMLSNGQKKLKKKKRLLKKKK